MVEKYFYSEYRHRNLFMYLFFFLFYFSFFPIENVIWMSMLQLYPDIEKYDKSNSVKFSNVKCFSL